MEKNNKFSHFIRKEGFYVILFICLCIVATIFAVTSNNKKIAKQKQIEENNKTQQETILDDKNPEITLSDSESDLDEFYNNALEVKKNNQNNNLNAAETEEKTVNVSKKSEVTMIQPVKGTIARKYSEIPVYWDSTGTNRPNFGIDIKADLGKTVSAVCDGVVVKVGDSDDSFGKMIMIEHNDGMCSVYANLSEKIPVEKGQKIKQGDKIGEVGNTSLRSFNEKYGSNLHFELLKDNKPIDPTKYIKY